MGGNHGLAAGRAAAMVLSMNGARLFPLVALLSLAGVAVAHAGAADGNADCEAVRDKALSALATERISIESALDNDAAISGAPEYDLQEARDAVIADINREREAVRQRYRQCVAEKQTPPAK